MPRNAGKHVLDGSRDDARLLALGVALHGVRLARARLPIGNDAGVVALQHVQNRRLRTLAVHVLLHRVRPVHPVECKAVCVVHLWGKGMPGRRGGGGGMDFGPGHVDCRSHPSDQGRERDPTTQRRGRASGGRGGAQTPHVTNGRGRPLTMPPSTPELAMAARFSDRMTCLPEPSTDTAFR